MNNLIIHNWDKWQSYRKDRDQPPWIKIHRRLMRNPEWVALSDSERGQLVSMWLLAADHNGGIPASSELIQKLCFMDKMPNLNKFIDLGFIEDNGCHIGVTTTPKRRQHVTPEENRIEEKRREYITLTPDEYLKLKTKYPEDRLEWMFDKLDFWADKKKKVINGYRYFKKGSWLLEEMEKHFNMSPKDSGLCEKCGKEPKYLGGLCSSCHYKRD